MNSWTLALLLCIALGGGPAAAETDELQQTLAGARTAIGEGRPEVAAQLLEAWPNGGDSWEIQFWIGTAQLLGGRLDAATDALDQASSLQPGVAEIWVQRAVVEQERGRPALALQLLEVAAQLNPDQAITWLNAGLAYESLGDPVKARGAYGRFLKLAAADTGSSRMRRLQRDVLNRLSASTPSS